MPTPKRGVLKTTIKICVPIQVTLNAGRFGLIVTTPKKYSHSVLCLKKKPQNV